MNKALRIYALPVMVLLAAALLSGCGATLIRTPCDKPRVSNFNVPSSYIVVLPYGYKGRIQAHHDAAGIINQLATLQALQAAAQMKSTQITLVEGRPNDAQCDIENVYDRVLDERNPLFWRRPYHSAIFVWGELFDHDEGVVVQSHMRVFWNGPNDRALEVAVAGPTLARPLKFSGDLPSDSIAFPGFVITAPAQQRLAARLRSGLHARAEARADAAPAELPRTIASVNWRAPWLELRGRDGQSAWLHIDESAQTTRDALPAALFAQAMASYLNHRVDSDAESRRRTLDSLARFRAAVASVSDERLRLPLALADVIEGSLGLVPPPTSAVATASNLGLAAQQQTSVVPELAQRSLDDAARQLPNDANVLNLAAIARIPSCCDGADAAMRIAQIQQQLERAVQLERGNLRIAANLVNWYRYLDARTDAPLPYSRAELGERTRAAERSLSAWSALTPR